MMLSIKTSKAAILFKSHHPLIVDEIILPTQLQYGQVLVELIRSGICGTQINEIDEAKGPDQFFPHLLGHEGFARVLEIGPGVQTVSPNDFVVMHWRAGSGIQSEPAVYQWDGRKLNSGWVTTFSNHSIVSENRVTKVTPNLFELNIYPLLGCALTTSLGVLNNDAKVKSSDTLLIFGCGGIGLLLIKLAKVLGIKNIVAVDINKDKLVYAKKFGASSIIKYTDKTNTLVQLKNVFRNDLPSVAIETSGNSEAIELCYELSAPAARVILVGVPRLGSLAKIYTLPLHLGKVLKGSYGGESHPDVDIPEMIELISKGILNLNDYPTHMFKLDEINDAIIKLRSGTPGRIVLNF